MNHDDTLYYIYIFILVFLTAFISFEIMTGRIAVNKITGQIINDVNPKIEDLVSYKAPENGKCPCQNVGASSNCEIKYRGKNQNPNLSLELKPNVSQIADGEGVCIPPYRVEINSHGFRGDEHKIEKPEDTIRTIVLGDSYAFGHGLNLNETYSKVLERMLNEDLKGNYQVLNFGVPGYSAKEKVELLESKAMKFEPDLIIYHHLGYDLLGGDEIRSIAEKIAEKRNMRLENLSRRKMRMIHLTAVNEYKKRLSRKNFHKIWQPVDRSLQKLYSLTNRKDIDVVLLGQEMNKKINRSLRKISKKYNWTFISVDKTLAKYPQKKIMIHPKDQHPTAFAHRLIGERVFKEMGDLVDQERS